MQAMHLTGRAAWVTGGASGMGRAIALALAGAGANVAIGSLLKQTAAASMAGQNLYLPDEDELHGARDEIAALGVDALAAPLDVRSADSVRGFFEAATARFGRIDILINAAGAGARHPIADHPDNLWHDTIDINLNGPYRTIKLCLPGMVERRWGRIVNIVSTAASVGFPSFGAYCSAKSGLLGLTRCVALEGAEHGVTCNAISPGTVATPSNRLSALARSRQEGRTIDDVYTERALANPRKRLVDVREIAAAALFLCQEDAAAVNMENLTVSGGALW